VNSKAIVTYRDNSCIGLIDKDFGDYYFSLIPKYLHAKKQKYQVHITIVRNFEGVTFDGHRADEEFEFNYSPIIKDDDRYFYLECWSPVVDKIRLHYGLKRHRLNDCHHITIGNKK